MKRGFLNTSKGKSRPLGPAPALNSPATATMSTYGSGVATSKLPIGKRERVDVPEGYDMPIQYLEGNSRSESASNTLTLTCTSLPYGDDEYTECLFYPGSKEVLTKLPGFPQPVQRPAKLAHRIGKSPGKGLGVFATRALTQGELILAERPLLISPPAMPTLGTPTFTPEQRIQHTLNQAEKYLELPVNKRMAPGRRAAFLALANSHKEDGSGPLLGIVRTNSICVEGLRPGVEGRMAGYSATCNDISRLNHSCSPNTYPVFDKLSLSFRLFAVRDVAEGEELTFQYVDALADAATRQEELKPYDLVCTCPACTQPTTESDARRKAIPEFTPTVIMWAVNQTLSDDWLIDKCREQMKLIEREGLEHVDAYAAAARAIMEAHIALGDTKQASEWAVKVKKCGWAESYKNLDKLLDPTSKAYEKHPMYCMRKGEAPKGSAGSMYQQMARIAGQNGMVKTFDNGVGMMMFPANPGMKMPPFPFRG